jgi:hypothetical protein
MISNVENYCRFALLIFSKHILSFFIAIIVEITYFLQCIENHMTLMKVVYYLMSLLH